jgi:tyrosyl-tRNA synthetase
LIKQGAVRINDDKAVDPDIKFMPEDGSIIKAGKRKFIKIVIG